uniref:G-protein coupled receptors family 2 profile 2 domain-containing protein n=1 Tax=Amphimedon queenslandica TaxID=400682 RepID=A0A1X7SJB0_AMPQE
MLEYTMWIKLMFTFCLTFHLFFYSTCNRYYSERFESRIEKIYVVLSMLGPLLFTWIPFVSINSSGIIYGLAGAWCWIQNWQDNNATQKLYEGEIEQYVLLYIPALICLLLSAVAVVMTVIAIIRRAYKCCGYKDNCSKREQIERQNFLKVMLPLVSYPILSFVFYIPAFINRVIGSASKHPNTISFMWSAISLPLVGLLAGVSLIIHIIILKFPKTQGYEEILDSIDKGERKRLVHSGKKQGYKITSP